MFTIDGRDPARTSRVTSLLWARATKLNLRPVRWRLGFFEMRDVLRARDPHFQERPYSAVRIETLWGCDIEIWGLSGTIELIVYETDAAKVGTFSVLTPNEDER